MKVLPGSLQAHLDTGATTLCWCWRLTRRDSIVQGFTDHDRDVMFDGTAFEAASGFTASEIRDSLGLSVDNLEVTGAITSQRLDDADLEAGIYDDAKVEIFRVNWADPAQRVLMRAGSLGEVKRAGPAFSAEVRGLAHYLQQPKGRLFQYTCDADLGDARCTIDLEVAAFKGSGTIAALIDDRRFTATGIDTYAAGWFSRGLITFTAGAALGQSIEVRLHSKAAAVVTLELWQPVRQPMTVGQAFTIKAGCDKHAGTCQGKFANSANFRGFPHMPGNDFLTAVSRPGSKAR